MSILGNAIMVGGGSSPTPVTSPQWKDVNFIDYDGSLLYSYTATEFAALTALPDNPTHSGLTAQGWNWTLADAKTQVTAVGECLIGQNYVTSDGKTRIYIRLNKGRLSPILGLYVNGTVSIDWGDGSSVSTLTGTSLSIRKTIQHTYPAPSEYIIAISVTSGSFRISGDSSNGSYLLQMQSSNTNANRATVYLSTIQKIELGNNCTLNNYGLSRCQCMESISLPLNSINNATALFHYNYRLQAVVLPSSLSTIGTYTFTTASSLQTVSMPKNITLIGQYSFNAASSLKNIVLNANTTVVDVRGFYQNYALSHLIIPNTITSLQANAFYYCTGLAYIKFLSTTPPTAEASTTFSNLTPDCKIYVPQGYLSAYTTATNYPSSSTYTYVEY